MAMCGCDGLMTGKQQGNSAVRSESCAVVAEAERDLHKRDCEGSTRNTPLALLVAGAHVRAMET